MHFVKYAKYAKLSFTFLCKSNKLYTFIINFFLPIIYFNAVF